MATTLDATRHTANWARRTAGGNVLFPDKFMLITGVTGVMRTRTLMVSDVYGDVRLVPHDVDPINGLIADIRGALFDGDEGSVSLLLLGSCLRPGCRLYAYPKEPALWDVESLNIPKLKAFMHAPAETSAWKNCHYLPV